MIAKTMPLPIPVEKAPPWRARLVTPDYQKAWFSTPALALVLSIFLVPLVVVLVQSFYNERLTLEGYAKVLGSTLFWRIARNTIEITLGGVLLALVLGYPLAYFMAQAGSRARALMMILLMLPFWTSILVKSFAFIVILGERGVVKAFLRNVLGIDIGVPLIFNRVGLMIGMVHFLVPFIVFPLLNNLLGQPVELRRAAEIMGGSRSQIFWRITFPLSLPAVVAGATMTTVLSIGIFVTPALLGGRGDMMVSNLIDFYTREALDWNLAAALSIILLLLSGGLIWILSQVDPKEGL